MGTLADLPTGGAAKLLIAGDSGSGKTCSIASIVKAGYEVFVADTDNGVRVLRSTGLLTDEEQAKVKYLTFRDKSDGKPTAWNRLRETLITKGWVDGDTNYGKIDTWDSNRVLILDTLTFAGKAAINFVLNNNNRQLDAQLSPGEWGDAARALENLVAHITSDHLKCQVIVFTHLRHIEDETTGLSRSYPASVGAQLSTIIPRYFNDMYMITNRRNKEGVPMMKTVADGRMALKCSLPNKITGEVEADLGKILKTLAAT